MIRLRFGPGEAPIDPLRGRWVVVFGYGNQGRAQALNLRDSGMNVTVALRPGSASTRRAEADGLSVSSLVEGARQADVAALLLPDEAIPVVVGELAPHWKPGVILVLAHGYALAYGHLQPPAGSGGVACVAPAGPGTQVRARYQAGSGVSAFLCLSEPGDARLRTLALAYAAAIGCARAGVYECSFRQETEVDLFGEQAVLCGGLSALLTSAFDTLVEAGYPDEMAYLECVRQVTLTADLVREGGLEGLRDRISPTALFGELTRGPLLAQSGVRETMRRILDDIRSGRFAREWGALAGRAPQALAEMRAAARHERMEAARKATEPGEGGAGSGGP